MNQLLVKLQGSFHLKYSLSFLFLSFLCGFLILMISKIKGSLGVANLSQLTNVFAFCASFMVITSTFLCVGYMTGLLVEG